MHVNELMMASYMLLILRIGQRNTASGYMVGPSWTCDMLGIKTFGWCDYQVFSLLSELLFCRQVCLRISF